MKPDRGRRSRRMTIAAAGLVLLVGSAPATAGNGVTAKRDEFGIVPEEAHDKDLLLPDPVLDRTWPGPKPGEGHRVAETGPEEDDERVPEPEEEPAAPSKRQTQPKDAYDTRSPPRPPIAIVGPDGRRDPGTPAPEIDPALPDVLGKDAPDLSDLERDEARPSTYDRGGGPSEDYGDAGDCGGADE